MFTGLVQAVGAIVSVRALEGGVHIEVQADALAPRAIATGDSIAVNGVCLTATGATGWRFGADVSQETLSKTTGLDVRQAVNLETSLAVGEKLGGHLVAGHVDGVGTVLRCDPIAESVELVVLAPVALARYLAPKGSVAVDGVSLTINRVRDLGAPSGVLANLGAAAATGCEISINLVPHTLAATTLRNLSAGSRVNLEADLIARYVARMLDPALGRSDAAPEIP
ncbi:MAG TPA: riboflavin synthase [Burkholderiaceae bacterium]|nr:riboflavin synthase [Burkholderiaceae bacterium]